VFARSNKTILKVAIILAIILMLIMLYVTGIIFVLKDFTPSNLIVHKLAALLILVLLGVHTWLRRCSIRKLLQECIAIISNKHIRHEDNIDFLMQNTKNQTFRELCLLFNCDVSLLQQNLLENHIRVENIDDTLKTIAKHNDKDIYQVFLLMIKLHVEKNSTSPIYTPSCDRA